MLGLAPGGEIADPHATHHRFAAALVKGRPERALYAAIARTGAGAQGYCAGTR
jgi:hypothetical protein